VQTQSQAAPGDLEYVRRFINTWSIPNQTRVETDVLPLLVSDEQAWAHELSPYPRNASDNLETLLTLRSDLRKTCANHDFDSEVLNAWFKQVPLRVRLESDDGLTTMRLEPVQATYTGHILAIVANAMASGEWSRLKTCGDCQWAFYDHTRNGKKRWCGMSKGGPEGRACGTIAKVSAFRQRAAEKAKALENAGR
jgi:hypothetical protein